MKQEMNPMAVVGIIIVAVALLVVFGFRALKPAGYTPSPGVVHEQGYEPGSKPGDVQASGNSGPATTAPKGGEYYPAAPADAIPGKPVNSGQ